MSSLLCISGWGQQYNCLEDSLDSAIHNSYHVSSLNYSQYASFEYLAKYCQSVNQPEVIIGWSLGGQIALRLIAQQIFKPHLLILVAPPFQLVKDHKINAGMAPNVYQQFYENFSSAPDATLKKFAILSLMNDKNKSQILKNIKIDDSNSKNLIFWLEELKRFTCFDLDFSRTPPTIFFMGRGDMVVHSSQVKYFEKYIGDIQTEMFSDCGHAPHLSHNQNFNELIIAKMCTLNLM